MKWLVLVLALVGAGAYVVGSQLNRSDIQAQCEAIKDSRAIERVMVRTGAQRFGLSKRRTDLAVAEIRDDCKDVDLDRLQRLLAPGPLPREDRHRPRRRARRQAPARSGTVRASTSAIRAVEPERAAHERGSKRPGGGGGGEPATPSPQRPGPGPPQQLPGPGGPPPAQPAPPPREHGGERSVIEGVCDRLDQLVTKAC